MTPEREAVLRKLSAEHQWGCQSVVAELLAELDALRERVGAFRGWLGGASIYDEAMIDSLEGGEACHAQGSIAGCSAAFRRAVELGLFEEESDDAEPEKNPAAVDRVLK